LEVKVTKEGYQAIRDLLLQRGHLIPPELIESAAQLLEYYDLWLEKFEKQRLDTEPTLESLFEFPSPEGFRYPIEAENRFRKKFQEYWKDLYGDG